jgi:hypothetical protein
MERSARVMTPEVVIMTKKVTEQAGAPAVGHDPARIFNWREFEPAMLNGNDDLAAELTAYRDNLDTLLKERGKYVVIKGSEIIGVYKARQSAMKAAFRFAPDPVLVKKIVEQEPVRQIGHVVP